MFKIASHFGEMLSAKAFVQQMGALCEWIERVALCLMIRIANQVAMRLVGVCDYYSFLFEQRMSFALRVLKEHEPLSEVLA
ncbi:hypothetical protein LR48_Vigan02g251500 [Vigna angularis]|uniref:Uncharacterized protein n=1 Tax=Phaseolus angularis TaxID=3914 RepID=A0A0L9U0P7_PHAAN|nr:hypothetical protein LR48_Vigan02g251500 [Vigna angularis]